MKKDLTEDDVAAFLESHPDFFKHRDSLLLKLKLPHGKKGTVSLIEKQLAILREKHQITNEKLNTLFGFAERNEEILNKCRKLALNLIAADNREEFLEAMAKSFTQDFKCQAYSLIIFDDAASVADLPKTAPYHFIFRVTTKAAGKHAAALIKTGTPVLGPLRPAERDFLFREKGKKVKSAVVLPVNAADDKEHKQIAMLAIGSEDTNYFDTNMDTNFLGLVADTLGRLIPKHLPTE